MKKSIAAIAVAGMLTIGMVSLPSAAMADETGTSGATTEIGPNMTTCDTDRLCDTLQHVHQTGQQLKTDLDTAKQHAEQLHQNAHDDADALRQYSEQAWKNYQEDREDIKTALDGASKRGQEVHDTLHQDAQDTQAHLNQLHTDLQEDHAALKTQHDSLVAARQEWHKSFIQALKDTQNGLSGTGSQLRRKQRHSGSDGFRQRFRHHRTKLRRRQRQHGQVRHHRERVIRESDQRGLRRRDQVGVQPVGADRYRHLRCLCDHPRAERPCLRRQDVRAIQARNRRVIQAIRTFRRPCTTPPHCLANTLQ